MHIMTTPPYQLPFPQAQLLLHELNHRIGNEFCCAVSVVSLAAARSNNKKVKAARTDVAELAKALDGRFDQRFASGGSTSILVFPSSNEPHVAAPRGSRARSQK